MAGPGGIWGNRDAKLSARPLTHQPRQVEVWSEKGTVRGILAPVLDRYGVTFRVMHGYGSATAIYDVAKETSQLEDPLLVVYVGDYDCSGMHMSVEDLPARLDEYGANVLIERLALRWEDVNLGTLPFFWAETKKADPRYRWYVERYGDRCWELDAMDPRTLRQRLTESIEAIIDWELWERAERTEKLERESLAEIVAVIKGLF